jgi:hypothetical protein
LYLLFKELYQDLYEKYRKNIDTVVSENYEAITQKDSIVEWQKNFERILYVYEKVLVNNVEVT